MKTTLKLLALLTLVACGSKIEHPTCNVLLDGNLSYQSGYEIKKSLEIKGFEFNDIVSDGNPFIYADVTKIVTRVKENIFSCKINTLLRYRDAGKIKYFRHSYTSKNNYSVEDLYNCEQEFVAAFEPLVPTCEITGQN